MGGSLLTKKNYLLFTARWSLTQSPSPRGFTCGRGCARWLFPFNSISGMDLLQGSAGIDDFPIWVQLIPRFLFRPLPIYSHIDSISQGHLQCDLQQDACGLHHSRVFAQLLREFLRPRRRQFGKSGHRGVQVHVSGEFTRSFIKGNNIFIIDF